MKVKLGEERKMKCCVDVTRQCCGTACMGFVPITVTEERAFPPSKVPDMEKEGWRDRQEETSDGRVVMTKFFPGGKCGRIYGAS